MIDLKETKRIKDALFNDPENFLSIIEGSKLAICITNEEAKFVAVNENYVQLYGFERSELIGESFTKVVPPENQDALKKYHDQFFRDKYEILRKWIVLDANGDKLEIFADAGYNEKILNQPHKITLIQFQKKIEGEVEDPESYSNSQV